MYTVICIFRVKKKDLSLFIKIAEKSGDILQSHGALDHHIFFAEELTGRQGSMGLLNFIEVEEGEELLLGQSFFKNEQHYHEVLKDTGSDDMIHYLDAYIKDIVEMNRVVTSIFSSEQKSPVSEDTEIS
ncbi:DUF1428 family protein [Halobacillus salinarum]|uniref:DUF1428 family protein n=1 Tax=Halobacillus salinarum TaxID=2932257 RepID=A0ABY4EII1_9BACI|nr:DUF1428 family protein [Halobacillus salinarum]UOQ43858.1 DUF1428 family protein [Halobacillus salinarum]